DAEKAAALVADDEPALRIDAHADPRAFLLARHRVEPFDGEVLEDLDLLGRRGDGVAGAGRLRLGVLGGGPRQQGEGQQEGSGGARHVAASFWISSLLYSGRAPGE